jgi:hypothetical protein
MLTSFIVFGRDLACIDIICVGSGHGYEVVKLWNMVIAALVVVVVDVDCVARLKRPFNVSLSLSTISGGFASAPSARGNGEGECHG